MEQLIKELRKFRDERNWAQFHTPKDLSISVSVEAAELLELFQWRAETKPVDAELTAGIQNEAADVFLYLLLLCDAVGIDLLTAAKEKIRQNEQRFPVVSSHGVAKPEDVTKNR
ncbi:nucleotide pyrophosphohydrolase [Phyllobacterium sp. TAF24]|uniref:nucleotide pyrophosphohydrolase n=1 Tax=Phyllobacterium sp. TAF24 TaxID=3233068 RepID=UPI003F94D7D4